MTLTSRKWNGQPMMNQAMLQKLSDGKCLDLSECRKTQGGDFILEGDTWDAFLRGDKSKDGIDLCVAITEEWIWSVGRDRITGRVIASTSAKLYQNPDYDCLWLR